MLLVILIAASAFVVSALLVIVLAVRAPHVRFLEKDCPTVESIRFAKKTVNPSEKRATRSA